MASSQKKYYISDLHFYNSFQDDEVKVKNLEIIETINNKVDYNDKLFILGDLTMSSSNPLRLLVKLLPMVICKNIYIIQGNHDEPRVLDALVTMKLIKNWTSTVKIVKDSAFDQTFELALSHYPISNMYMIKHPLAMLHGHTHGDDKFAFPEQFDVSLEVYKEPMTFEEILSKHYGHYANPLLGYIDYTKKFEVAYADFYDRINRER